MTSLSGRLRLIDGRAVDLWRLGGWCGYGETRVTRLLYREFSMPFLGGGMLNQHFVEQKESNIYTVRRCYECDDFFF